MIYELFLTVLITVTSFGIVARTYSRSTFDLIRALSAATSEANAEEFDSLSRRIDGIARSNKQVEQRIKEEFEKRYRISMTSKEGQKVLHNLTMNDFLQITQENSEKQLKLIDESEERTKGFTKVLFDKTFRALKSTQTSIFGVFTQHCNTINTNLNTIADYSYTASQTSLRTNETLKTLFKKIVDESKKNEALHFDVAKVLGKIEEVESMYLIVTAESTKQCALKDHIGEALKREDGPFTDIFD